MSREIEAIGRTIEEAKQAAIAQLRALSESDVEFVVLDEGSKGVFGLGYKFARVKAKLVGQALEEPQEPIIRRKTETVGPVEVLSEPKPILEAILELMNLEGKVECLMEEDTIRLDISGPGMGILIGKQGRTLDSLQFLLSLMVNRKAEKRHMVQVDVEGYRARREVTLKEMAMRLARTAAEEHRRVFLDPMQPAERRIIHLALADHPDVTTFSQGEEPMRKVVIVPRT